MPRIFLSYSHDDDAHRERVLALSERLRADGIDTILDQYVNGTPAEGWPRWMLNGLDAADRVILICTPTYYRRFRGHEVPGLGKGVDWEGAIITQEVYEARSQGIRFIPVLFDPADAPSIPEPLRGRTHYCLTSQADYAALYDDLLDQAGVAPGALGVLKRKPRRRADPLVLPEAPPDPPAAPVPPRVDLNHLPAGAEHFLGRQPELAALDSAWAPGSGIAVVEVIAPGGTGKTALVKRWLDGLKHREWGGAGEVYGWSFYSQGTGDDRQASEDQFLAAAIQRFGVTIAPSGNPADKGQAIAERICQPGSGRTLLILDGCEPLQYPPGPCAGELRAPGLKALLGHLAGAGQPGLCLVTSRERLADLTEWVRTDLNPQGAVLRLNLEHLSDRAGAAAIQPDDPELLTASRERDGHALTLSLLGRYLARAKDGDIRQRDAVALPRADRDARGHAARVVEAYETWFARAGLDGSGAGTRELAALRLLGYFDRPAAPDLLAALRAAPPIAGLTEALFEETPAQPRPGLLRWLRPRKPSPRPIPDADWTTTLANLADCGLVERDPARPGSGALDAHPLVREVLAAALAQRAPEAWREGHRRLYERLKAAAPHRPEGLDGLQPLYQAVAHGCRAGLWQEACDEVYHDRILRGTGNDGFYSTQKLGAFGADLGAIAALFAEPWSRPVPALKESHRAWLRNEAAIQLRALGRLTEALEPMRAGAEMAVQQEDWKNAAIRHGNLSELQLSLGRVAEAAADGARSVEYADRSGEAAERMINRTTLADALHQRGETDAARRQFAEAESQQAQLQPQYPLLYSLRGFLYCDLLLAGAERAAWGRDAGAAGADAGGPVSAGPAAGCEAVAERARQTLEWVTPQDWLLEIALDHLTLARCALYADRLAGRPPGGEAQRETQHALDGLRAAGAQEFIVRALLTRAWLRAALGDPAGAAADLAEAQQIATRGAMQLHLADCFLSRARLFHDPAALTQARALIEQSGYGRRLPELEDAEGAAVDWPAAPEPHSDPPRTPGPTPAGPAPGGPADATAPRPPGTPAPGHQSEGRETGAPDLQTRGNAATQDPDMTPDPATQPAATPVPAAAGPVDFLLVAPLREERDALLARLPGHRKLAPSEDDIRVYYAAEVAARFPDGRPVSYSAVVLPLARMGHTEAAGATGDAIRRFQPRYVLLVGIAGGIAAAGVGLGDVLLSDQVADYELAKVTAAGPSIRWQVHPVDQRLLIAAQNHDGDAFADLAAGRPGPGRPRVHIGPICTGNKVIADDSLASQLREVWVKLIGVEMEAGGVANAASQSARRPGFFMVRGVSDLADADKDRDEVQRWRQYACDIAAAWTLEWLKSGPVPAGAPAAVERQGPAAAPATGAGTTDRPGPAGAPDSAVAALLREKIEELRKAAAICSDAAQKFTLRKQIEEAQAELKELS